jgi:hypothetical protein
MIIIADNAIYILIREWGSTDKYLGKPLRVGDIGGGHKA